MADPEYRAIYDEVGAEKELWLQVAEAQEAAGLEPVPDRRPDLTSLNKGGHMSRNPTWSREELILALDTYLRIGMAGSAHPEVQQLSRTLNNLKLHAVRPDPARFRNPNDVAMKLANFAALDPSCPGIALSRGGRGDAEV